MSPALLRLCSLLVLACLVTACSDSSDTRPPPPPRDWSVAALQALQPSPPEAELAVDAIALDSADEGGVAMLLDGSLVQEPAIRKLSRQILLMTSGMDAAAQLRRMVFWQLDTSAPEYLLLADTEANTIAALYGTQQPERSARYRGVDIYQHPELKLSVAMLPGALFAAGFDATLRELIDTLNDQTASSEGTSTVSPAPIQVTLELPGSDSTRYPLSLQQATRLTGGFTLQDQTLEGTLYLEHPMAQDYIARFNALATDTPTPPLADADANRVALPVSLPLASQADRFSIRQLFQGFDGVNYAEQVQVGGNPAWLNFNVGSNPNSIFINFEFASPAQRRAFEASELPAGFRLAPLRILDSDQPGYFLVLNVYQSSGGLVSGARAEWSVFVEDPDTGAPRFLVVQAAAESIAADPVNLLTFPEPVSHTLDGGRVRSYVGELQPGGAETLYFESSFPWPDNNAQLSGFAREFVAANDFIFWGNGIADRGVFNGTVYARQAAIINADTLGITDNSRWARYVNPAPRHSVIYRNPLDIIISPWWNLDADYLDVTDDFLQEVVDFSNAFYPMTAQGAAEAAFRGEQGVVRADQEGQDPGSLNLHFRITDPQGLAAELELPTGTELALLPLVDGGIEETFLTLHVFRYADSNCGWQAQWLAYLRDTATGSVSSLRLQALAAAPCLDADILLQEGAAVALQPDNDQLQLDVVSLDSEVSVSVNPTTAAARRPSLAWLAALDSVCGRIGVCDRRFIDGQTLDVPLQEVDPSGVDISALQTPWSDYIEPEPLAVWVRDNARLIVQNPWDNALREDPPQQGAQ